MKTTIRSSMMVALILGSVAVARPELARAGSKSDPPATGANDANIKKELSDAEILGVADTANTRAIDQANVAVDKAQADSVKQYAQTMLKDHTEAKEQGRKLLAEVGISVSAVSAGLQKEGDDTMTQLETVLPSNFDRTYLQAQVRQQQSLLRTLDSVIPQTQGPQLKGLMMYMRQLTEQHLATARSTLATLGR
ncbi:MAG TPA: DUF4142 domain-containing protein [Polyangiaceae bacterium]|nr:DUF4142 domain-containing protein [Polyangiaceae bacterium]